eukprot:scaffold178405_cov30-Tisochrysis_lutea.AAC.8
MEASLTRCAAAVKSPTHVMTSLPSNQGRSTGCRGGSEGWLSSEEPGRECVHVKTDPWDVRAAVCREPAASAVTTSPSSKPAKRAPPPTQTIPSERVRAAM